MSNKFYCKKGHQHNKPQKADNCAACRYEHRRQDERRNQGLELRNKKRVRR